MGQIFLIASDLDGTLLTTDKRLSPRNRAALAAAAARGIHVIPATGRFFGAMPEAVRELPFVRYCITINGARVFDRETGATLYATEMPPEEAVDLMSFLDTLPVVYDCFLENAAWMSADMRQRASKYMADPRMLEMVLRLRQPVPDLKAFVREKGIGVQKVQFFTLDLPLRDRMLRELSERFPRMIASSSGFNNVEINHMDANKGAALLALAAELDVPPAGVLAFGDGLNDLTLLRAAGVGVAMGNAVPEALAAAKLVTDTNDNDGVAQTIERILSVQ